MPPCRAAVVQSNPAPTDPPPPARPVRLVQFSDPHLFDQVDGRLLGVNTQHSFEAICDLIDQEQAAHMDAILVTGDIAQVSRPETYTRFLQHVARWPQPCYWLQGNHDLSAPFESLHPVGEDDIEVAQLGQWCLILIDSSRDHHVEGYLTDATLQRLRHELEHQSLPHVVIALHHHPLPVGSHWIDQHVLHQAEQLWQVLDQFPQVRLVLHGHTHQAIDHWRGPVRVLGVPSTCVQFKPHSHDFALDDLPPGYRWLDLHDDGHIETGIVRLDSLPQGTNLQGTGY